MFKIKMALAGLTILVCSGLVLAIPKPSPVPVEWELQIKFQDIKRIRVEIPGEGQDRRPSGRRRGRIGP